MLEHLNDPIFWLALGKIIWIDILLSGDNALVIAMACRNLEGRQRRWGILLGAGAAIGLRVAFTGVIAELMLVPYLKLVGAALLLWVAVKLCTQQDDEEHDGAAAGTLWSAIRLIVLADIVMSLDNMIAVAGAANGNFILLALGLLISIPLIVGGATLITSLLKRFPVLITMGGGLLGYIAGEVFVSDPLVAPYFPHHIDQIACAAFFAAMTLAVAVAVRWGRTAQVR